MVCASLGTACAGRGLEGDSRRSRRTQRDARSRGPRHLGPPIKLGAVADPLPARIRAGALWRVSPTFDAGFDFVCPVDQDPFISVGVEARLPAARVGSTRPWTASVRAGFDENRTRGVEGFSGVSAGGGLDFSTMRFDYAWVPFGDLGTVNRITMAFRF